MTRSKVRRFLLGITSVSISAATLGTASAALAETHGGHHRHHHHRHRTHHHVGIPQNNGGDRDSDNNGAPSDGDGNQ